MADLVLGALTWDPQLKGGLIALLSMVLLPGSVYLILGTDLGMRLGFLVAAAGFMGWMVIMGLVWTVYGIGLIGRAPAWTPEATVRGDISRSSAPAVEDFPDGWKKLAPDNPEATEAQAVADEILAPSPESGKSGPYKTAGDFMAAGAYEKGGEDYFLTLRHKPHYLLLQVQGVVKQEATPGGAPPKPTVDPGAPVTSVVLVRDLGNLRVPPAKVTFYSLVLFGLLVYVLHKRDKEAMAARAEKAST